MSDECPRQISFVIPGNPAVQVTATENNGAIDFRVDVLDSPASTGDLRALFFDFANEGKLAGLTFTGGGGLLTEQRVSANNVLDLGDGATLAGQVKDTAKFDIGLEWGTPGGKKDDINFEVQFKMTNAAGNLTLDDIAHQRFGAKLDSVGGGKGTRNQTTKLLTIAPAAPDAVDDSYNIFEDGAADKNSPSKAPTGVTLAVLGNDTDADGDSLIITAIHHGPEHGSVEIATDGKTLIYTPDPDYAGTNSFEYCVSDGKGGQDHAEVNLTIEAVADDPVITWEIQQGANINEILLLVTAKENDADHSEYIDDLSAGVFAGLPAGAQVDPSYVDAPGTPGQITQQFIVTTAAMTDYDFNLDFTATAVEFSNNDTEDNTETQRIQIVYNENTGTLNYVVQGQSIWDTGDEFKFTYDDFLGIDKDIGGTIGDDVVTGTFVHAGGSLKVGFDVLVDFEGGQIDATVPVDVSVNTTYNKTTDVIYFDSFLSLGEGGSFITEGPTGKFKLDFIFEASANLHVSLLWFDVYNDGFSTNLSENIFDLDAADDPYTYPILPGIVDVSFDWPEVSVSNDPGVLSGSAGSNNFLYATLDVDQLANALTGGLLSFIDTEPTNPDNFELLDLDITGGLNLIQTFAIGLASTSVQLVLEDGAIVPLTFGTPIMIEHASTHDSNDDGQVDFTIAIAPNVTLQNKTELGGSITGQLTIPKNFEITLVDEPFTIINGPIATVFDSSFALQGVGSQNFVGFA